MLPIIRVIICACLTALGLLAGAEDAGRLLVSHREMPMEWGATETSSLLVPGPDGRLYFTTASPWATAKFGCFDPRFQRFELLADLGELPISEGKAGRAAAVVAPVVFDRHDNAWLGASALPSMGAGEPGGRLLCYSLRHRSFINPGIELSGFSIVNLGIDRKRNRLLLLAEGNGGTRFFRYGLDDGAWKDCGGIPAVLRPAMAVLADGSAVIIGGASAIIRYDPVLDSLRTTACRLPAESAKPEEQGVCALLADRQGRKVYGITRAAGLLFEYDPAGSGEGTLRCFGPAFEPGNEEAPVIEPRMALGQGADGMLYYAGFTANQGRVMRLDPRLNQRLSLGEMATPYKVLAPALAGAACPGDDGRMYLAGFGWPGCGLYAFPPLPERTSWSTTDRSYRCRRVRDGDILLDGSLDEKAWQRAEVLAQFVTAGRNPRPARQATEARILWSDTRLYYAFHCEIDDIRAAGEHRDDDIWTGECAEIFLCPQGADAPYFEFDINPHGIVYDSRILGYTYPEHEQFYKDWAHAWDAAAEYAVRILRDDADHVTGWVLEASLPFATLGRQRPRVNEQWLFNVIRLANTREGVEYQCWHPTYAEFHRPHQFPKLRFVR